VSKKESPPSKIEVSKASKDIKKKKGRPFRGKTSDNISETHIKEKRAILRQFSKFFRDKCYEGKKLKVINDY
jgi:hypothetical protein